MRLLNTDRVNLYLLHWSGTVPLAETMDAFAQLQQAGQIRNWGVSYIYIYINIVSMEELETLPCGREVQTSGGSRIGSRAEPDSCRVKSGRRI